MRGAAARAHRHALRVIFFELSRFWIVTKLQEGPSVNFVSVGDGRGAALIPSTMTRTVVFANNKGGVGKSTLSTNLAAAYALKYPNREILFVDMTLTRSISSLLLGDATVFSMASIISMLSTVKRRRENAMRFSVGSIPVLAVFMYAFSLPFAVMTLIGYLVLLYLYLYKYALRIVDPTKYSSRSTLFPNLSVLVGGETLANISRDFPWKVACSEWHIPASVNLVIIDIDNTLDDYARWAMSVANDIVIPTRSVRQGSRGKVPPHPTPPHPRSTQASRKKPRDWLFLAHSLNEFDFERLGVDPRNNSLFEFVEKLKLPKLRYKCVIFNRVRCAQNLHADTAVAPESHSLEAAEGEDASDDGVDAPEFKLYAQDEQQRNRLAGLFRSRIGGGHKVAHMREISGNLMNMAITQKLPIVKLSVSRSMNETLQSAIDNLTRVAVKTFDS